MKIDKKTILLILGLSSALLAVGLLTTPCLGDEISHYRQAKAIFHAHSRVVTEPVYQKTHTGYFYNSEAFWHLGLAALWALNGQESAVLAQIYHTLFTVLLLFCVYLFAAEQYGEKAGFLSVLILASMPMMVAFGILFYIDVPVTALSMLGLLSLTKRKIFFSALALSAAVFTKATVLFFLPAFIGLLLKDVQKPLRKRLAQSAILSFPMIAVAVWDFLWRRGQVNHALLLLGNQDVTKYQSPGVVMLDRLLLRDLPMKLAGYANASFLNFPDVLKYFGAVVIFSLVLYLLKRREVKVSALILFPLVSYFIFFCYIFHPGDDIRYLLPVTPFLAIMAASAAASFWNFSWFRTILISLCLLQFGASINYVSTQRKISPETQEGFHYIKEHVPETALVIYPEYIFLEQTERGMIWSHRFRDRMGQLFWDTDKKEIVQYLVKGNIGYLAVKKDRIYDDSHKRHFGGYPKSFVDQLGHLPYFQLLYDNKAMSVWRIVAE